MSREMFFRFGVVMVILGAFGGFETIANVTGIASINELSKDWVVVLLGWTWIAIGRWS